MCTLGDEYTVSIVWNHNIQLSVPAGRAWTVIFCSTAPRPPVGLLGTTGISTDFALSQYSLSISIFINHNVVLSSSTGQWTRLRYCWWGEIYPAAASKAQRRLKSYRDDRRQTDIISSSRRVRRNLLSWQSDEESRPAMVCRHYKCTDFASHIYQQLQRSMPSKRGIE